MQKYSLKNSSLRLTGIYRLLSVKPDHELNYCCQWDSLSAYPRWLTCIYSLPATLIWQDLMQHTGSIESEFSYVHKQVPSRCYPTIAFSSLQAETHPSHKQSITSLKTDDEPNTSNITVLLTQLYITDFVFNMHLTYVNIFTLVLKH